MPDTSTPHTYIGVTLRNRRIIAGTIAASAVVGFGSVGCATGTTTSGTETFSGTSNGGTVAITASGPVSDNGSLRTGNGNNDKAVIKAVIALAYGNIDLSVARGKAITHTDAAAESLTQVLKGTYKVTGATGKYKGTSGSGTFTYTVNTKFLPGTTPAQMPTANRVSITITFHATGPLTTGKPAAAPRPHASSLPHVVGPSVNTAPPGGKFLSFSGSGTENSGPFPVPRAGSVVVTYTYDCSTPSGPNAVAGMSGQFIAGMDAVTSAESDQIVAIVGGIPSDANQVPTRGGQTITIQPSHPGGQYFLSVASDCSWSFTLTRG